MTGKFVAGWRRGRGEGSRPPQKKVFSAIALAHHLKWKRHGCRRVAKLNKSKRKVDCRWRSVGFRRWKQRQDCSRDCATCTQRLEPRCYSELAIGWEQTAWQQTTDCNCHTALWNTSHRSDKLRNSICSIKWQKLVLLYFVLHIRNWSNDTKKEDRERRWKHALHLIIPS